MSLVHEKLYRSESLSKIDFTDYTRYLTTQLFSFYRTNMQKVKLEISHEKTMVGINTAVPLGLIMNELVSNALKHAFTDGREGTIFLDIKKSDHTITILYRDNGVGIPLDFDWRKAESLGLRLINILVDQLFGTIELDRSTGTAFTIVVEEKE
jgi:two-component sensor histidine kinase